MQDKKDTMLGFGQSKTDCPSLCQPIDDKELDRLRTSVNRGDPLAKRKWVQRTSQHLG